MSICLSTKGHLTQQSRLTTPSFVQMCFAPQRRALFGHGMAICTCWHENVLPASTACTFSRSQLPTVFRSWGVLRFLTSKRASRHSGVRFFDIQLPTLFRTRRVLQLFIPRCAACHNSIHVFDVATDNFQKWSDTDVFYHLLTSKYASRRNGEQFFISQLPSSAALAGLLFDPPELQITGKIHVSRLSYLFARLHLVSSDFLLLWSSPSLTFSILTFSMSELLPPCAFPSFHMVGSLASNFLGSCFVFCMYLE